MSATILAFPRSPTPRPPAAFINGAAPFSAAWCDHHLPLVEAAMDLLAADDVEFGRRCELVSDEAGQAMLEDLAGQINRLGAYIGTVAEALTMTAGRLRTTMAQRHGGFA